LLFLQKGIGIGGCANYDLCMYKNTVIEKPGGSPTLSMVDADSTQQEIAAETLRLGNLGITRVVFRDQRSLNEWRQRVAAGESLRLQLR